ncbi:MAG: DUF3524 domain-containing protein [Spirochaetaceae bacterium]
MKILLLSAYNTQSHNYWGQFLIKNLPEHDWVFLELPPRKFSWRIRGNPLSWMAENSKELGSTYDTILATSMVDLSTIIGLFPHLGCANKVIYFHENQFEYPLSDDKNHSNVESMMVNLYGAFCADRVVFNSKYNRDSFFSGGHKLLRKINDHSPVSILEKIRNKSTIIPVPICDKATTITPKIKNSLIWNHRWEYDKNPEDYYKTLKILEENNIDFKLIMMGIQFKNSPRVFDKIKSNFSQNILCWGQQSKEDYISWLSKGELIVSTAIHEFQGLAVMEAVQYGAIPIVPNRLSYPEWFPKPYLYDNSPEDMAKKIITMFNQKSTLPDLNTITWNYLKSEYVDILSKL